jgi:glycosyltransferase involved in cell wall biosynthesis
VHGLGGVPDVTRVLAGSFRAAGHDVEVITARHPEELGEEVHEGIRWRYVDAPPFQHLDPTWMRRSYEAFLAAEAEAPFDAVHGQGSSALELVRRGVHHRVPVVTHYHGNLADHAKGWVSRMVANSDLRARLAETKGFAELCFRHHFRRGNWYRLRATEAIVPSSAQAGGTRVSHLLRRSRIHIVPNGIDAQLFRPRPGEKTELRRELGLGEGLLFVCVSRLNKAKGIRHAVRALAALDGGAAAAPPKLVIVGDGKEEPDLRALADELGIADRVHFAGPQPPEAVAAYLAACDIFLFPTEFKEAGPVGLLQAMAAELPVVASDVGAVPEAVGRDGSAGILVPVADVDALIQAMRRLADDGELRTRLGRNARQRVLDEYTLERMTERMLAVYEVARARLDRPPEDAVGSQPARLVEDA